MVIDLGTTGAVVGILASIVAILSAMFVGLRWLIRAELHENSRDTKAVLHQVKNSHETNLREDIDAIKQAATDAKALAAEARATGLRTEAKVDEHVIAANLIVESGKKDKTRIFEFQTHLDERQAQLEQSVSDLSSAIKTVAESTPPDKH